MTTPHDIVAIARGLVGVRFAHQGRCPDQGLDCLGFLLAVARQAKLMLRGVYPETYDRRDYGARPDTEFLECRLKTLLTPVTHMGVADILLLRVDGRAQHLAMVSDYPEPDAWGIIHAYAPARKVVEHRLDRWWQSAIAGIYRLPCVLE